MHLLSPVIGILRGIDAGFFAELLPAAFAGGLKAIEVTMNTPDAERMVTANRPRLPDGMMLGMGTVRCASEAHRALDAGAMFLVSPNFDPAVIDLARAAGVPMVAGALTPTEVYSAWQAGADLIKVFPCGAMGGPSYVRDLLGPYDALPLAAVGGVTLANVHEYFAAGVRAVGVSTALFGTEALARRDLAELQKNISAFIARCHPAKDRL